jgi:hypothetical protein
MPIFQRHLVRHDPEAISTSMDRSASHTSHHPRTREQSLLDLVIPDYHFRGRAEVRVNATPAEVLIALKDVTLADMPLAFAIGSLRYLPGRMLGKQKPADDQLTRPFFEVASPFLRLGEDPGREVVIGSVGKFHNILDQQMVDLPDLFTFTRFNDAGYQKLAMNFCTVPAQEGAGTILTSEHRTLALSPASRRKFAVYWYIMVRWGSNFMLRQLLKAVKRRAEAEHIQVIPNPLPGTAGHATGWRGHLTDFPSLKRFRSA